MMQNSFNEKEKLIDAGEVLSLYYIEKQRKEMDTEVKYFKMRMYIITGALDHLLL